MKKIRFIMSIMFLVVGVSVFGILSNAQAEEGEQVSHYDAARVILDKICLEIRPSVEDFPAIERFGILSNALADARGIQTFLGKNPEGSITVGEMQEVFETVTEGKAIKYDENRGQTPEFLSAVFALPAATPLTLANFSGIIGYFPNCESDRVETYVPPQVFFLQGADPEGENDASEI
jgi:hypothetical protein